MRGNMPITSSLASENRPTSTIRANTGGYFIVLRVEVFLSSGGRVGHELLGMHLVCVAARSKHRRYGNRLVL